MASDVDEGPGVLWISQPLSVKNEFRFDGRPFGKGTQRMEKGAAGAYIVRFKLQDFRFFVWRLGQCFNPGRQSELEALKPSSFYHRRFP